MSVDLHDYHSRALKNPTRLGLINTDQKPYLALSLKRVETDSNELPEIVHHGLPSQSKLISIKAFGISDALSFVPEICE